jgi:uncharacterized protein
MSSPQVEMLQVLAVRACLEHLHSRDLGRVAFQIDRDIDVLPVNYATDGQTVIFRTGTSTRLHRSPRGRVTFEVDSWDPVTGVGWSVVLKGVAREITSGTDLFSRALRERTVVPLAPGKRDHWIAIFPSEITGRMFRASTGERPPVKPPNRGQ